MCVRACVYVCVYVCVAMNTCAARRVDEFGDEIDEWTPSSQVTQVNPMMRSGTREKVESKAKRAASGDPDL